MKDGNILLSVQVAIDALDTALEQLNCTEIEGGAEIETELHVNLKALVNLKVKLKRVL